MELLYFLEEIRNPVTDVIFSFITLFGEETVFILLGLVFFWCVNKNEGYYLLSIGFIGTIINQFLKLWFRIPRPWVNDPDFTIVESAREAATGYSFPSGHTQSSVGIFGGLARWNGDKAIRIISLIFCVLVPLSRMYLGVHTPLDVGVSVAVAVVLIFVLYPLVQRAAENAKIMRVLLGSMTLLAVIYLIFVSFYKFPADIDADNLASGTKNAYKMLGCTAGIFIAFEIDRKYINFDTRAPFLGQVLKLVIGLVPLLFIKEAVRFPLNALFGGHYAADGIRYFLIVIFAGCIWPLTFKKFAKISKKITD